MYACHAGSIDCVKILIEKGSDVNFNTNQYVMLKLKRLSLAILRMICSPEENGCLQIYLSYGCLFVFECT